MAKQTTKSKTESTDEPQIAGWLKLGLETLQNVHNGDPSNVNMLCLSAAAFCVCTRALTISLRIQKKPYQRRSFSLL